MYLGPNRAGEMWECRVQRRIHFQHGGVEIFFRGGVRGGSISRYISKIELTSFNHDEHVGEVVPDLEPLEVSEELAQNLMDELWRCGFKPTEGFGSVGQIGAVQEHLKDAQTTRDRLFVLVEKAFDSNE